MNQSHDAVAASAVPAHERPGADATGAAPRFPATDMPILLMIGLVALGLPRTVLADLDVVPPESGALYYALALTPFAVWLIVATRRRTRRPLADFVVLGVHQGLWELGPSLGYHPPASAVDFAEGFAPSRRELAERAYTCGVAMMIGVGAGLVSGLTARVALVWRTRRAGTAATDGAPR